MLKHNFFFQAPGDTNIAKSWNENIKDTYNESSSGQGPIITMTQKTKAVEKIMKSAIPNANDSVWSTIPISVKLSNKMCARPPMETKTMAEACTSMVVQQQQHQVQ